MKVLIVDGLAKEGLEKIKKISGIELVDRSGIDRKALLKEMGDYEILIVRSRTQVDSELLSHASKLKLAIRAGIGVDNIDIGAATERGVIVMNAPTGNIVTTAEHTLALLFSLTRHIPQADASIRQGKWEKKIFEGNELRNKTIGIVGFGNIGRAVAERAAALKMSVLAYDPFLNEQAALKQSVKSVSLDTLLTSSDYITLHMPLADSTRHLFNKDTISKMKRGAFLINCARGGLIDEKALVEALESGQLSGCALDVFETEPPSPNDPLLKRSDVVLTPHLGASTEEAQVQVSLEVAEQVLGYVKEGALKNALNVPNITVEQIESLRPFLNLCERLGSFAAQAEDIKLLKNISIRFEALNPPSTGEILSLWLLSGFLSKLLGSPVNTVNVRKTLKDRGISWDVSHCETCEDYSSLIEITLQSEKEHRYAGTLFGKGEARIVRINEFNIDGILNGVLLYTKNNDTPGVIGAMGTMLGSEKINIARMHLGRRAEKEEAIALISIDSEILPQTLSSLKKIAGMISARQIKLS
jgi:D-3-phosphoglycerate dehydrogenase